LKQLNNEADKEKYKSKGVRTFPCWEWLPLDWVLISILHELLGLGNDLVSSTKGFMDEAVEPLTPVEKQARTMALLAELAFEEVKREEEECALDVEFFAIERRQLSKKLATRRTLAADLVESLEVQKIELTQLEKDTRKKRNGFQKNRRDLWKQCLATNAAGTAIRAKRGKKDRAIANLIQSEVLDPKGCFVSSYHGDDMKGVALQIMLVQGRNIFAEIEAHI
jgi:hypothetical protein